MKNNIQYIRCTYAVSVLSNICDLNSGGQEKAGAVERQTNSTIKDCLTEVAEPVQCGTE